jgi:hypothetical protein
LLFAVIPLALPALLALSEVEGSEVEGTVMEESLFLSALL